MVTQHVVGGRYGGTYSGDFVAVRGGRGEGRGGRAAGSGTICDQRQRGDSLGATMADRRSCRGSRMGGDHR